jgi:hypothetical protein
MTDPELIDLLEKHDRMEWRVSMSRAGTFLIIADTQHELTDEQAVILWDLMRGAAHQPERDTAAMGTGEP